MKTILPSILLFGLSLTASAQTNSEIFWNNLQQHCGKAYLGEVIQAPADDDFRNHDLIMHVRSCDDHQIKIPFFVGDDRSRTWVLTYRNGRILLKHDHRHEDGSEDEITQYGGLTTSSGLATLQAFPADQETADLIPATASNIWWIEIVPDEFFTYNLRRIGTDRYFSIRFRFADELETPEAPWGWNN